MSALAGGDERREAGRAMELAAAGRFLEAITAGEATLAAGQDPSLARAIVGWRRKAYDQRPPDRPRPEWPPNVPDPFPGLVDKIPEVAAPDLTAGVLDGGIEHHGSLIVRGLLSTAIAGELRSMLDHAFAERAAGVEEGEAYAPTREIQCGDLTLARAFLHGGSLLMVDAPAFFARWIGILKAGPAHAAVAGRLGEAPVLSARKTTLYRAPPDTVGQWHQDGAFLGPATRTVNLWVALSDCGVDSPGLDIVPWRLNAVEKGGTHGSPFDWAVGDGRIAELAAGRRIESPVFTAGDAMLFDHLCLHSTGVRPGMTRPRYAVETWMFAPSHYPDEAPLVI